MGRAISRSALAVALLLTASLAACTDDPSPPVAVPTADTPAPAPASSSPSPAPSAAPVTPEEAKRQALETYLGMQAAFEEAGRAGDASFSTLQQYTTGAALDLLTTALINRKKEGVLARGETVHHAEVTAVGPAKAPTKATVQDCMDTRKSSLFKPNGDPVPQDKGGFRLALSDLKRTEGTWKVTTLAVREVGSCKP
jgi:hypothetical protein